MTYHLGVDLGTTITTAAVARDGKVGVVTLGEHSAAMPSVLYWGASGPPLVGDAAVRAAATDPSRAAREVRPRVADPTPLLLDGAPFAATALLGAMLRRVVDLVAEREGGAPEGIVLTHPATWGDEEREAFAGVAVSLGLGAVSLVSEPEAAAARYAAREGLRDGGAVAVVDLGGGSVDATVLVHRGGAFTIAGRPEAVPYPTDAHPTDGAAVAGLHRALASARRLPGDLDAVVLVGWSTRTGAIAAALADELGRPVSLENEPEHTVALGAAGLAARGQQNGATTSVPVPAPGWSLRGRRAPAGRSAEPPQDREPPVRPGRRARPGTRPRPGAPPPRPRRGLTVGLAAGAIVLGIVGAAPSRSPAPRPRPPRRHRCRRSPPRRRRRP
ncbi:Hsp70 family protein [Actinomycetospora sp. CA-053990]|uniref:Hsp70 family protein n=1 Tax=Actinomycetospora sp. CA-053990 TaxID=3239891 RepID=UPI003D8A9D5C